MERTSVCFYQPSDALYRKPLFDELTSRGWAVQLRIHRSVAVGEAEKRKEAEELPVRTASVRGRRLHWASRHGGTNQEPAPDVVVLSWDLAFVSLVPAILQHRNRGSRVVLWGHGFSRGRTTVWSRLRLLIAKTADVVALYDEESAKQVRESGLSRALSVGNGLETTAVSRSPLRDNGTTTTLLFVARLSDDRGLPSLIDSIGHRPIRLVIVGDGPERERLEKLATRSAAEIVFRGALYGDDPRLTREFAEADFLFLPVGGGLSFVHALQLGIPVITQDDRSVHGPEFSYLNRNNSLLYKAGEEETVLDRLQSIDQPAYESMVSNALLDAEQTLIPRFADRFEEAFEMAVNRPK